MSLHKNSKKCESKQHGCLKPTINEFEYFFGLKYQRSWCNEHIRDIFTVSRGRKSPNQETGLGNSLKVLNDIKFPK